MAARRLGTYLPIALLALVAAWLVLPGDVEGNGEKDAVIGDLSARVENESLLASFQLDHALGDDFQRKVRSGLPTEIIFEFELRRPRRSWFNATVARSRMQVVAMYNVTTDEYLVNFKHDGELASSRSVREVEAVRAALTRHDDVFVFPLAEHPPSQRLHLRVRAELGTKTWLAFIPRTLETDWAVTETFIPQEGVQVDSE
ncbi:MAG: DUF4390 domain-containing protein [Thermoanaerobaculia bacterium]|nr:DUF4390 domain-containing protein [Thermoanaerobaculia bacterium]